MTSKAIRLHPADNVVIALADLPQGAVPDALGRSYNRTQYLEQRRELMTQWADYLDQLQFGASETKK